MSKTKVLFAYCHEFERAVSIDEARAEFFSLPGESRKRFTFSCSDRHCSVGVTGVNYHVKAEDGHKFKDAHYRSHIPHRSGCEWLRFTEETEQEKQPDESEQAFSERQARQKLTDFIDCFDPTIADPDAEITPEIKSPVDQAVRTNPSHDPSGDPDTSRWSRYTRTNQLQRLIDSWQQADAQLSREEVRSLRLNVVNYGQVYLHQYITHIGNGLANRYRGVVYGGASLVHRYGRGFLLSFYDWHEGKPIKLYVSKDIMNQSRFGHYVDEILCTEDVKYFRIFLLNPRVVEKEINRKIVINLEIDKLRQLAIYYELKTETVDE